ncbi:uncharacterized protein KY384_001176 [Bacidia gigantensis]|uniref:uncharacterized protein n=1 Tax=Bacidia gigantensis TaxID=2732470 RepID=UPI001D037DFF|nr:uncharacterized protein KY384_001176 [Bacidia gigantensis]KAG8534332.1 hypothetical protein KY384_001176 [Bacidia gigantensis]
MDALQAQCKDADKYPLNMSLAGQPKYTVDLRHRRLRDDANRLFKADKGFLEFLEFSEGGKEFIDFLLIFGRQTRAQHFHFCAFKQRTRLASCKEDFSAYGLKIPSIGWSGRDLQLCYNLKSMETSSQGGWPWSVRDCVINHSFDLEKVRCTWIVIKGNALIQDRIRTATKYQSPSELSSFQSTDRSFASTLATHSIIANWAAENWDIYITFVEARFHEVSCRAITNEIDISGSPTIVEENAGDSVPRYARTDTGRSSKSIMSLFSRTFLNVFDTSSSSSTGHGEKNSKSQPMSHMKSGLRQPRPPSISAKTRKVEFETRGQQFISVSDLQILHTLHERTNESVLVLQLNIKMMSSLVDFYRNTLQSPYFPESILSNSRDDFAHFKSTLQEVQYDLETHILRLNTLAGYIVECKTLVCFSRRISVTKLINIAVWHLGPPEYAK